MTRRVNSLSAPFDPFKDGETVIDEEFVRAYWAQRKAAAFPAWTILGVASLARQELIVEIKVVAATRP